MTEYADMTPREAALLAVLRAARKISLNGSFIVTATPSRDTVQLCSPWDARTLAEDVLGARDSTRVFLDPGMFRRVWRVLIGDVAVDVAVLEPIDPGDDQGDLPAKTSGD